MKPYILPFDIVIDTREQRPWTFKDMVQPGTGKPVHLFSRRAMLAEGDYALATKTAKLYEPKGMFLSCRIERKSLSDLYSTLGQGRERFEQEHERLSQHDFACIIIEADWYRIMKHPPKQSKLDPNSVFGTFLSWSQKYSVPWYAFPDRRFAEIAAFKFLCKFWEQHNG